MCQGRKRCAIPRVYLKPPRIEDGRRQDKSSLRVANPKIVKGHATFLGFAHFYRCFILGFSKIGRILIESTKGDEKNWELTPDMEKAIVDLKKRFTIAPILTHYSPERQYIVKIDTSDLALWAVISQKGSDDKFYPITYDSCKYSPPEINDEIHDKEPLAVRNSFTIWRKCLEGALLPVLVHTDYQNLEYFMSTKLVNRRHAREVQELAGIDYKICYHPRSQNGVQSRTFRTGEVKSH
jgi:hypothetical protein